MKTTQYEYDTLIKILENTDINTERIVLDVIITENV